MEGGRYIWNLINLILEGITIYTILCLTISHTTQMRKNHEHVQSWSDQKCCWVHISGNICFTLYLIRRILMCFFQSSSCLFSQHFPVSLLLYSSIWWKTPCKSHFFHRLFQHKWDVHVSIMLPTFLRVALLPNRKLLEPLVPKKLLAEGKRGCSGRGCSSDRWIAAFQKPVNGLERVFILCLSQPPQTSFCYHDQRTISNLDGCRCSKMYIVLKALVSNVPWCVCCDALVCFRVAEDSAFINNFVLLY